MTQTAELAGAEVAARSRIMLRPLASSLPLGFFAFGAGTVLLTVAELSWVPLAQVRDLMVIVLAFVAPLEVLAGIFAFLARDVGAATALCLLGAAWAATALLVIGGQPGARSATLGIFLLVMAADMICLAIAAIKAKPLFALLIAAGALRFALTGVYQLALAGQTAELIAGWIGIPVAAFSLYGGLALLLEDASSQTVLPVGRRGPARSALTADLSHQVGRAHNEAGIRRGL